MTDRNLQLDTLEAKGLIRLASYQPELEYLFRHALVQDTAYESLLKQERRALHRSVGDALEELYPERHGDLAAVLAMHFEQAGDTDRAVMYLMAAANFSYTRNAVVEAFDFYSRAAATLPPQTEDENAEILRKRVEIALGQARTGFAFLEHGAQLALIDKSVDDAERLGDPRLIGEVHLYSALLRQFGGERIETSEKLRTSMDRVAQVGKELDDPLFAALPKSIIGITQVFTGDLEEGIANLTEAGPLLGQKRDFVGSSFAMMALGVGYARLGEFNKADEASARAREVAEDGDIIARLDTLIGESMIAVLRGEIDKAVPLARRCTEIAEDAGATACVVGSNLVLGESLMRQGQFAGAKIALDRSNDVAEVTNQRTFLPSLAAFRRSIAAYMGDISLGGRTYEEALDDARELGDRWAQANIYWRRAEAGRVTKDVGREQVLADYAAANDIFSAMGARPSSARVLRDWGRALAEMGDASTARARNEAALALFEEMGLEREAGEMRIELGLSD